MNSTIKLNTLTDPYGTDNVLQTETINRLISEALTQPYNFTLSSVSSFLSEKSLTSTFQQVVDKAIKLRAVYISASKTQRATFDKKLVNLFHHLLNPKNELTAHINEDTVHAIYETAQIVNKDHNTISSTAETVGKLKEIRYNVMMSLTANENLKTQIWQEKVFSYAFLEIFTSNSSSIFEEKHTIFRKWDIAPRIARVEMKLFSSVHIPTLDEWIKLNPEQWRKDLQYVLSLHDEEIDSLIPASWYEELVKTLHEPKN